MTALDAPRPQEDFSYEVSVPPAPERAPCVTCAWEDLQGDVAGPPVGARWLSPDAIEIDFGASTRILAALPGFIADLIEREGMRFFVLEHDASREAGYGVRWSVLLSVEKSGDL